MLCIDNYNFQSLKTMTIMDQLTTTLQMMIAWSNYVALHKEAR